MEFNIPARLKAEQLAVEADIRAAFAGVTREGGVSWTETDAIDYNSTAAEVAEARAKMGDIDRGRAETRGPSARGREAAHRRALNHSS